MAPEQLARGETTIQSDLYSLGLVLYELFTGEAAHKTSSILELRQVHEESSLTHSFNKPAPPSGTAQSKDEDLIPAEIWNFPLEMDLKAPAERTRSGAEAEEAGEAR